MNITYHGQTPRLSEATVANGFVFLSGMVPETDSSDITEQTQDVLKQIDKWLEKCGSDKRHILEATIYLPDLADYAAMNAVWDQWVDPQRTPARACVAAGLANPAWKIEIKVSAVQLQNTAGKNTR
ncbi:RidA family protein [Neisseria sp. S1]|uniref:RidA family protein n=1 Tax=Neisseria sp. S1 TaxID=3318354 RepID=UPI003A866122